MMRVSLSLSRQRFPATRMVIAACIVMACGACSTIGDWFDDSKTKPVDLTEIKTTLPVRSLWTYKIGSAEKNFFAPALPGGAEQDKFAYVAAADGALAKLDLANGKPVWQIKVGKTLNAGVGVDADSKRLAVVSERGEVLTFDAEGKPGWSAATNSEVVTPPVIGNGVVVVRTTDSHFIAFDAETGQRRWTYQRQSQSLVLRVAPGMTVSNDLLYSGLPAGRLIALTMATGVLRWDSSVMVPKGSTDLERVADVVGKPMLLSGNVCAAAYQGRVACFDAIGGYTVWGRDISSSTGLDIDARFAFVTDDKSVIQGMSSGTGTAVWRNDKLLYRGLSAPLSVGRAVVVGDYKGILHWLSREDGSFVARTPTDGTALTTQPLAFAYGAAPAVLVQTREGSVSAFAAE